MVLLAAMATVTSSPGPAAAAPAATMYAWGSNHWGQLGDGTTNDQHSPEAITLAPGVHATTVSTGPATTSQYGVQSLAVGSDGNLYAWGNNGVGQLGDGTTTDRHSPEVITLAPGVHPTAVSAGGLFSLAIGSDNNLYAWGVNSSGSLGDGTTTDHHSPEVITLAPGVHPTAITAGGAASHAIGSDGNLYGWGWNVAGEVGDGTTTARHSPVMITLAPGVHPTAVSDGDVVSFAIGTDGKLYGWGFSRNGQLGDGTVNTDQTSPEVISLGVGIQPAAISAGRFASLAIGSDANLYAWGSNFHGALGDGTTTNRSSPELITLAPGVHPTAVSAGDLSGMAVGDDGNLYAWGENSNGELGDGTTVDHHSPEVITLAPGVGPSSVAAAGNYALAIGVSTVPDHFLCYSATTDQFGPHTVNLHDRFGSYAGVVAQSAAPAGDNQLCNPVEKTVGSPGVTTAVNNPQAHLYCYSDATGQSPNQAVSVDNQFGTGTVVLGASTRLCLPSWKFDPSTLPPNSLASAGSVPPGSWTDPIALGLDHYQCYSAKPAASTGQFTNQPATVGLRDQFDAYASVSAGSPTELCTPVSKSVTGVGVPPTPGSALFAGGLNGDYLLCYAVTAGSPHAVDVGNQFSQSPPGTPGGVPGSVSVTVNLADQLCVPSTATVPPPSTPEVPTELLLPAVAGAIGLGAFLLTRRRGQRSTAI